MIFSLKVWAKNVAAHYTRQNTDDFSTFPLSVQPNIKAYRFCHFLRGLHFLIRAPASRGTYINMYTPLLLICPMPF